jgi:hypothetical protein
MNPPFEDSHAVLEIRKSGSLPRASSVNQSTTKRGPLSGASDRAQTNHSYSGLALALTDILSDTGSSKTSLVELRGFEPLTPTLPGRGNDPEQAV